MKKVRIVSPAKYIEKEYVDFAVNFLQENGFDVEVGECATGQHNYFSGTIQERLTDFQAALNDPAVDIILCARGGYGSVQLIDLLDFTLFKKQAKLIVGYSDITVFHTHIGKQFGIETLHATVPLNFKENTTLALDSLLNAFRGVPNRYEINISLHNKIGEVKGEVVGGNLAIIYSLLGTDSECDFTDKILFIEEIGEAIYAIDRMFFALKKAGKLDQIRGLIVGGLSHLKDSEVPYGKSAEEVILEHVEKYNIPVCFNFPAGHIDDNRAVFIGRNAFLDVGKERVIFEQ